MKLYTMEDLERFWRLVHVGKLDECWTFINKKSGRPTFYFDGKHLGAHRFSFWIHTGIWPGELQILHSCDNKACINPHHLFLGTQNDNVQDCVRKGRIAYGERHGNAKLTEDDIHVIRTSNTNRAQLAVEYSVSNVTIGAIIRRVAWRHVNDSSKQAMDITVN